MTCSVHFHHVVRLFTRHYTCRGGFLVGPRIFQKYFEPRVHENLRALTSVLEKVDLALTPTMIDAVTDGLKGGR
jgi:hypothetical protein